MSSLALPLDVSFAQAYFKYLMRWLSY